VLETLGGNARLLASRNLDVVRESYELGRATLGDVLDETRRYLEFESAYTAALVEAFDARVALTLAMGVIR
jgi:outer membrane protein TolC